MTAEHIIYEIVGNGIPLAEAHKTALDAHTTMCWEFAKAKGATGYRPSHNGRIQSLFFDDGVPEGWRSVNRVDGKIECRPKKNTKAGKAIDAELSAVVASPTFGDIGKDFGWTEEGFVIGGMSSGGGFKILRPQFLFVSYPKMRYFLALPREHDDGFVLPDTFVELRQSEYMAAIEDHKAADAALKGEPQ